MPPRQKHDSREWLSRQADTDAYCAFRRCHMASDKQGKDHALSKMSSAHARRCAISSTGRRASGYAAKLDELLAIDGLREGFWLRLMHKVRSLGIEEKIETYLEDVREKWDMIEAAAGQPPTAADVAILENKCPRYSESDAAEIAARIEDGSLFPHAAPRRRASLLAHLETLPTLITSLYTFFADVGFMEQVVPCIYYIVDKNRRVSCSQILRGAYTKASGFEVAERKLWMLTWKHFDALPAPAARPNEQLRAKARPIPDVEALHSYATDAHRLGFASRKIRRLQETPPERILAKNALLNACRAPDCRVEERHIEIIQDAMSQTCRDIERTPVESPRRKGPTSSRQRPRYLAGAPDSLSFQRDREYVGELDSFPPKKGLHITSLQRLRSSFSGFFQVSIDSENAENTDVEASEIGSVDGQQLRADTARWMGGELPHGVDEHRRRVSARGPSDDPPTVLFQTLEDGQWKLLRRVQPATRSNVESVARELRSSNFVLFAVSKDCNGGSITAEECFDKAAASGIDTVLVFSHGFDTRVIYNNVGSLYAE